MSSTSRPTSILLTTLHHASTKASVQIRYTLRTETYQRLLPADFAQAHKPGIEKRMAEYLPTLPRSVRSVDIA